MDKQGIKVTYSAKVLITKVGNAGDKCAVSLQKSLRHLTPGRSRRSWLFPDDVDCSEDIELRAERLCMVGVVADRLDLHTKNVLLMQQMPVHVDAGRLLHLAIS